MLLTEVLSSDVRPRTGLELRRLTRRMTKQKQAHPKPWLFISYDSQEAIGM
jgi:hypothetical protein